MNSQIKLVSVTPEAEQHMAYVARVSNPKNQDNDKFAGLLKYCIQHGHWSVFEQAFMTVEINTTRGLAAQILRHRSFTYQEFSQRYADSSMLGKVGDAAMEKIGTAMTAPTMGAGALGSMAMSALPMLAGAAVLGKVFKLFNTGGYVGPLGNMSKVKYKTHGGDVTHEYEVNMGPLSKGV